LNKEFTVKFKYSSDEELKQIVIRLYTGQLVTSGQAARMLHIDKESFLSQLERYQVAVHKLDTDEVVSKMQTNNDKAISLVRDIVRKAKMTNQGRAPHFWSRSDMIDVIERIIKVA